MIRVLRLLENFEADTNRCWIYQGGKDKDGYGRVKKQGLALILGRLIHRQMYQIFIGPIPAGMCVLHRCDNPPCGNPEHLFLGTVLDNSRDRAAKRRSKEQKGQANTQNVLTPIQVLRIRNLHKTGSRPCDIAREYGVSRGCIWGIIRKDNWKWM